ncbi:MAG: c-type cytochrome biogenesis protein CcmI [Vibrionaceae bacterium]
MSELAFWLTSAALIIIAIAVVIFFSVSEQGPAKNISSSALNKKLYLDRSVELAKEEKKGIISSKNELLPELQKNLLFDITIKPVSKPFRDSSRNVVWVTFSAIAVLLVSYGVYFQLGGLPKLAQWRFADQRFPELMQRLNAGEELSDQEQQIFALGLRSSLVSNPDDAQGWLLLGKTLLFNHDWQSFDLAVSKAYALLPNDEEIRLRYAQALLSRKDTNSHALAYGLLDELQQLSGEMGLQALSLLALDAYERARFKGAAFYWQKMQQRLEPHDPRIATLEQSIARAKFQCLEQQELPISSVTVKIEPGADIFVPLEKAGEAKRGDLIVTVHESVDSPMPIATKKLPIKLPVSVTFTDLDTDNLSAKRLSDFQQIVIRARIDVDGNMKTRSGDWFGVSRPLLLGTSQVIVIDQKLH